MLKIGNLTLNERYHKNKEKNGEEYLFAPQNLKNTFSALH